MKQNGYVCLGSAANPSSYESFPSTIMPRAPVPTDSLDKLEKTIRNGTGTLGVFERKSLGSRKILNLVEVTSSGDICNSNPMKVCLYRPRKNIADIHKVNCHFVQLGIIKLWEFGCNVCTRPRRADLAILAASCAARAESMEATVCIWASLSASFITPN